MDELERLRGKSISDCIYLYILFNGKNLLPQVFSYYPQNIQNGQVNYLLILEREQLLPEFDSRSQLQQLT